MEKPKKADLKVRQAPAAFAETAIAHNALVDLIKNAIGNNGVKITVADGKMIIELSGGFSVEGNVVIGGPANSTPLIVIRSASIGEYLAVGKNLSVAENLSVAADATINFVFCNQYSVSGQTLTLQSIDVCDGGVTKSMYVLGTAPA